jgi:hypothetical protein
VLDDALGDRRADRRQQLKLLGRGGVDVDGLARLGGDGGQRDEREGEGDRDGGEAQDAGLHGVLLSSSE